MGVLILLPSSLLCYTIFMVKDISLCSFLGGGVFLNPYNWRII